MRTRSILIAVFVARATTKEEGDYLNCPMNQAEYEAFVQELLSARKVTPHRFEEPRYFEGCLPIGSWPSGAKTPWRLVR